MLVVDVMSDPRAHLTPVVAWHIFYQPTSAPSLEFFAQHGRGHGDPFYEHVGDLAEAYDAELQAQEAAAARAQGEHAWPRGRGARPPGVRGDAAELAAFVARAAKLPARELQVHELCIARGLSLEACAATLGIARTTVRTHLKNLRARMRASAGRGT